MDKPALLLHIGAEKTGTSSIQSFLFANRKVLAESGYYYLHTPGRADCRSLPVLCIGDRAPDDFLRMEGIKSTRARNQFIEETRDWLHRELVGAHGEFHTIIVSSEHLSSRLNNVEAIARLKSLFEPHISQATVICYLRNQCETLPSSYSTYIRSGGTNSFSQFSQHFLRHISNDLNAMMNRWESIYGRASIDVRVYSRGKFQGEDLLRDFSRSLRDAPLDQMNFAVPTRNRSLSRRGILLARAINKLVPRFDLDDNENPLNRRLVRSVARMTEGASLDLTAGQRQAVLDHFRDGNAKLRSRYFPDELFP